MSEIVISTKNLGKLYRLGEVGTGTVSHDLNRWLARLRGKEDPFAKVGEVNDRTKKGNSEYVWALREVNFDIRQGEAVGIIGRNGAGKSTLLKVLSKVTAPTTGRIKVKGRIASLLEVGTGFHPELTGRENIYLNGAILGMTKREITRKFDEIVDFAGVDRYIDTPVKRYSSGMYVRLAFAVAAYLESEILIVDEVLAVGDAEFQKKCLGKMGDVTHKEGRTILFVSHNMASIKNLCSSAILMNNGGIETEGDTSIVIDQYLSEGNEVERYIQWTEEERPAAPELEVHSIKVLDHRGRMDSILTTDEDIRVEINYRLKEPLRNLRVGINFFTTDGLEIISTSDFNFQDASRLRKPGLYKSVCIVPKHLLNLGTLIAKVDFDIPKTKAILMDIPVSFTVSELAFNQLGITATNRPAGVVHPYMKWEIHCEQEVLNEP
ncbi:ABC transporter ATP-binding protein [Flavisolibacter ginsenosidimutans]|uniref:ABC transporter ATP-binding protein n=1 Tax=Flavisolibacter ginsenosidimutans TaxID=661481 RepID=A0A5B8UDU9_9BACT|nr:ABC transporter ATP-binding protein [Flavisolibacter ginsenosidimutans]QEC54861.1 ABC transporter ATP-binding protein [Flavisolibacter ginsenosidimutans]